MSSPSGSLEKLQRWMQAVITHPGGVEVGAASPNAESPSGDSRGAIEMLIGRSQSLTAEERLSIYNRSYFARLLECLRDEFSVLAAALGEDLFDGFALAYLQEFPPASYTLADLGKMFPDYLAQSRPADDGDWSEFFIDLARLELTVNQVFDGPGVEGVALLDREQFESITPEAWPEVRLECVPCLKLRAFGFPVNDYFTAVRQRESPAIPAREASFVAVTRRDYRVFRHALTEPAHAVLSALSEGESVGVAISQGAALSDASDAVLMRDLRNWFIEWTAAGFFRCVLYSP